MSAEGARSAKHAGGEPAAIGGRACRACTRRAGLLSALGPRLDVRRFDSERLVRLLSLEDDELAQALGTSGVRDAERHYAVAATDRRGAEFGTTKSTAICRHDAAWPTRASAGASGEGNEWAPPALLHVAGDVATFEGLGQAPVVAFAGSRRASEQGLLTTRVIAGEVAACGVLVIAGFGEGVAAAALAGALEAGGRAVGVMAGGVDVCQPASERRLHAALVTGGCAFSELPAGERVRRWCYAARDRIVAGLADVVVVPEALATRPDIALPSFAAAIGRSVAALPGRVSSPLARGCHALIKDGATLVEGTGDVLDLLHRAASRPEGAKAAPDRVAARRLRPGPTLAAPLRDVLRRIHGGADTLDRLTGGGVELDVALVALAELELHGLVVRGAGGRYLPSPVPAGETAQDAPGGL